MHKKVLFAALCVLALNALAYANVNEFQRIATQTPAQGTPALETAAQAPPCAQEPPKEEDFRRFEIKLDLLHALLTTFKVGSEYWVDNRNALAITALYNFSTKPELQGQILANYRLYFIKAKKGPWLFAEINSGYTKGYERCDELYKECYYDYYEYGYYDAIRYHAFTVGLAVGLKFFVPTTNTGLEGVAGFNRLYGTKKLDVIPNYALSLIRRF